MTPAPLFELRDVSFRYPAAADAVLLDIAATIPTGAVVALLGRNGSGKTTLLNLLGTLWEAPPEKGEIAYRGPGGPARYADLDAAGRDRLRRERFGFVLQSGYFMPALSCLDNIAMPLRLLGRADATKQAEALLGGLEDGALRALGARTGDQVSGGEARCLAVLRAIIHQPDVVFADEPAANLDQNREGVVRRLLLGWRQQRPLERTLILVTHNLPQALEVADYFLVLTPERRLALGRALTKREVEEAGGVEQLHRWVFGAG